MGILNRIGFAVDIKGRFPGSFKNFVMLLTLFLTVYFGNTGRSAITLTMGQVICQIVCAVFILFHLYGSRKERLNSIFFTRLDLLIAISFILFIASIANQMPFGIISDPEFLMHLSFFFLYFAVSHIRRSATILDFKLVMLIIGLITVLYGLTDVAKVMTAMVRINTSTFGPFGNANIFAGIMVVIVPIIFSLGGEESVSIYLKILAKIICILLLALVFFYSSRGAVAALLVMIIWFAFQKVLRQYFLAAAILFIVSAGILSYMFILKERSSIGRFNVLKLSIDIFRDKILSGIGYRQFDYVFNEYQALFFATGRATEQQMFLADIMHYPLNELLHLLLEFGFGIVFVVIPFLVLIFFGRRPPDFEKYFSCSMLVFLVFSLTSYPLRIWFMGLLFIFLMGFLNNADQWRMNISLTYRSITLIRIASFLVVFLFLGYSLFQLKLVAGWRAADSVASEDILESSERYDVLYPYMKGNGRFMLYYGKALHDADRFKESIDILNKATFIYTSLEAFLLVGDCYEKIGSPAAEKTYLHACDLVPSRLFPKYFLMNYYTRKSQTRKAKEVAKVIISSSVKVHSAESNSIIMAAQNVYYNN